MYRVIKFFTDLQDFNHPYKVGDEYPRIGVNVSESRLAELSSVHNKRKEPLIEKVETVATDKVVTASPIEDTKEEDQTLEKSENHVEDAFNYTKTEINRMTTASLRELAKEHGVQDADNMVGTQLKQYFIENFNL